MGDIICLIIKILGGNNGVSTNFLLSKMAGDFSKQDKVHTFFPEGIERKMWPLSVSDLFFSGRATVEKLHRLSIQTIGELDQTMITHQVNKGYSNSLTAPEDYAKHLLLSLCETVGTRLRGDGQSGQRTFDYL